MSNTQQKLMYASVMLEQAKLNSNDYSVFIANLDAFVTNARSVTLIMQKEFDSITGFKEWYDIKQTEMKNDPDFKFFNKLRVDTTHVHPFNTVTRYTRQARQMRGVIWLLITEPLLVLMASQLITLNV